MVEKGKPYYETPCEHGYTDEHCDHWPDGDRSHGQYRQCPTAAWCNGGLSTEITLDYEAADSMRHRPNGELDPYVGTAEIVDAALGVDA